MTTRICHGGLRIASLGVDTEGYRTYQAVFRVESDTTDGPYNVLLTSGLPLVGEPWLIKADADIWAWCRPETQVRPVSGPGEPETQWDVEKVFSTRPLKRCHDQQVTNPLLQPLRISGNFIRYMERGIFDRFGKPILTSSHERIADPMNDWDGTRMTVRIDQNVADLQLSTLALLNNTVNAFPLWGMPPRTIKLNVGPWSVNYYGFCFSYYSRSLEFEIRFDGWDRNLNDIGTQVLRGTWQKVGGEWIWQLLAVDGVEPDPKDPTHFVQHIDQFGNPTTVVLDGNGQPFVPTLNDLTAACSPCNPGLYGVAPNTGPVPDAWNVTGFTAGVDPEQLTLHHQSGCNWSNLNFEGDPVTLTFDQGTNTFVLSYASDQALWSIDLTDWKCAGPNTLAKVNPGEPGPASITLTAGSVPYLQGCGPCSPAAVPEAEVKFLAKSPKWWRVTGFNETLILEHQDLCVWSTTDSLGDVVTLSYDDVQGVFDLVYGDDIYRWRAVVEDWMCLGPNTMHVVAKADDNDPDTITLTTGSQPGVIHIEKYHGADWLQIGVPLSF